MLITEVSTDDVDRAVQATRELFPSFSAAVGEEQPRFDITVDRAAGLTYLDYAVIGLRTSVTTELGGFGGSELIELDGNAGVGRDALDADLPYAFPPTMTADCTRIRVRVVQIDVRPLRS